MAWNHDTVVLSFRGTASFRNVLADLKVTLGICLSSCHISAVDMCHNKFNDSADAYSIAGLVCGAPTQEGQVVGDNTPFCTPGPAPTVT